MKIRYRQCRFVDKETKDLMREREKWHRLARKTQLPSNWNDFYRLRNVIKKKLRDAEKVLTISNGKSARTMITKIPYGKPSKNVFREKKYRSQYIRKIWAV